MKENDMDIAALVRRSIAGLQPYVPGTTVDEARRRYGLQHIVKLSSNENPWGSSPKAIEALHAITALNIYVNDDYRALRERLSAKHGVPFDGVVLGHGSNEILAQVFRTFVDAGDEVVMGLPTFSLYRNDAVSAGAAAVEIPLRDGVHDLDAMARAVTAKTKLCVICDPNNPTGTQVQARDFQAFLERLPERVMLVLDQAYREYAQGGVEGCDILRARPNTIVLRTASKVWGLAALRFGYAFTHPEIAGWLARTRLPFNVALPALAAVNAALDDEAFIHKSVTVNASERRRVIERCAALGLKSYPSEANFVAVAVPMTATEAYTELLQRGVIVRSGDGLRMPGYLRITIGTPAENDVLLAALGDILAGRTVAQ